MEAITIVGPGVYIPDATEGITRVEDLPKAKIVQRSRNYKRRPWPKCERSAYRLRIVGRILHYLGDPVSGRPVIFVLRISSIGVLDAIATSTRTWMIWRCPRVITRTGWWLWWCDWRSRMVCLTIFKLRAAQDGNSWIPACAGMTHHTNDSILALQYALSILQFLFQEPHHAQLQYQLVLD